ncbi:MAG: thioredoxin family protein [Bdellovibrionales bacterium]|nr:thioredoxin family protein [Bdellovibrionales bacterium]
MKIFLLVTILLRNPAYGQFFDRPIQYFDEVNTEKKEIQSITKEAPKAAESKSFEWNNHLDENKDEFFREGDYIPPAPFLEVVRRPTAKNILLFEKWKEKKNQLLKRYNEKRVAVLGLKGLSVPSLEPMKASSEGVYEKLKEYQMVFYFDSKCPSCKGMYQVVNQLADNGVYIEAVRLDSGANLIEGLRIPWSVASAKEMSVLKISAVPMLMIFEDRTKQAFKVIGKKSAEEILSMIQRVKRT